MAGLIIYSPPRRDRNKHTYCTVHTYVHEPKEEEKKERKKEGHGEERGGYNKVEFFEKKKL